MSGVDKPIAAKLLSRVDKLMTGKRGCSFVAVAGHVRLATGAWVAPGTLAEVLALCDEAVAADAAPGLALATRADIKLCAGLVHGAEADWRVLEASGSHTGVGILPLRIAIARGDRAQAVALLDTVNARNRSMGLPLYRLSEFALHQVGPKPTKADMARLRSEVEAWAANEPP